MPYIKCNNNNNTNKLSPRDDYQEQYIPVE